MKKTKQNGKNLKKVVDIAKRVLYNSPCVMVETHFRAVTGCGSAWLERLVWDQEVAGSNPVTPIAIVRVWFNGRTPAFQAGYVGSIPITRFRGREPRGIYI